MLVSFVSWLSQIQWWFVLIRDSIALKVLQEYEACCSNSLDSKSPFLQGQGTANCYWINAWPKTYLPQKDCWWRHQHCSQTRLWGEFLLKLNTSLCFKTPKRSTSLYNVQKALSADCSMKGSPFRFKGTAVTNTEKHAHKFWKQSSNL